MQSGPVGARAAILIEVGGEREAPVAGRAQDEEQRSGDIAEHAPSVRARAGEVITGRIMTDDETSLGPLPTGLRDAIMNSGQVRRFYRQLDHGERAELITIYRAYEGQVLKRLGEGWRHGWVGNRWGGAINLLTLNDHNSFSRALRELERERITDARAFVGRLGRMLTNQGDIANLMQLAGDAAGVFMNTVRINLEAWGQCDDWAQEVTSTVRAVGLRAFRADTRAHLAGGDDVSHTFCVLFRNAGGDPPALALDPWLHGRPELLPFNE